VFSVICIFFCEKPQQNRMSSPKMT
jgi:hypothetical protein